MLLYHSDRRLGLTAHLLALLCHGKASEHHVPYKSNNDPHHPPKEQCKISLPIACCQDSAKRGRIRILFLKIYAGVIIVCHESKGVTVFAVTFQPDTDKLQEFLLTRESANTVLQQTLLPRSSQNNIDPALPTQGASLSILPL